MAQTYVVKPGDSLSKIASQYGVSIGDISGYSSGNPNMIRVGESLSIGSKSSIPSSGKVLGASTGDLGDNAVIGAGPNAGMTPAEVAARDSKNPPKASAPSPALVRPKRMNDADWARMLGQSPFLVNDNNSATGYRNPSANDYSNFQRTYVPTLSQGESDTLAVKYGLKGLGDVSFTGMTASKAKAAADKKKQELLGAGTLKNPSSFFQVTQLNNIKKATEQLTSGLNTLNNDPWKTGEDKKLGMQDVVAKATNAYAGLFKDPQEFISAYQSDPSFSSLMADYVRAGGTVADVADRISKNASGVIPGTQSVSEYLLNGQTSGAGDNVYTAAADKYLDPNRKTSVDEINRLAQVPQQYIDLYYGSADKIGIFQKIKSDAKTTIDNLNKAYGESKKSTSEQFDYQVQKNEADAKGQVADLEEKRLQAKNYLTGRLAQLGSLTTSGAAPEALANLDAKYERGKAETWNALNSTNSMLLSKKREAVNSLESDLTDKISSIKSNLSKSEGDIEKEIYQAKNTAQKAINVEIDQYNTKARSVFNEFLNTSNKTAQQYIKEFLKTASGGMSTKYLSEFNTGLAALDKKKKATTPGSNPLSLTPTNKRDLQAAGLTGAKADIQTYFLKTDPAFQKEWSRNVQLGQNKNPTVENLHNSYTEWYNANKKKTTKYEM